MNYNINNQSKKQKKKNRVMDACIKNTYGNWLPIQSMNRSFFVWRGKWSGSFKEKQISSILNSQNLTFYREVSFDLLRRFDFYIPLIDLVIEYDGKQHFNDTNNMVKDVAKEKLLDKIGVKLIRYHKGHDLEKQILHDLVYHPVLMK